MNKNKLLSKLCAKDVLIIAALIIISAIAFRINMEYYIVNNIYHTYNTVVSGIVILSWIIYFIYVNEKHLACKILPVVFWGLAFAVSILQPMYNKNIIFAVQTVIYPPIIGMTPSLKDNVPYIILGVISGIFLIISVSKIPTSYIAKNKKYHTA